jgi:ABC-type multidrug transport system fused ATPase/permease subunit
MLRFRPSGMRQLLVRVHYGRQSPRWTARFFASVSSSSSVSTDDESDNDTNTNTNTNDKHATGNKTWSSKPQQQPQQLLPSREDSYSSLTRLLELSRQEWSLIGLSASTLLVTSSVTLLLPYASGAVIDYTTMASSGDGGGPILLASGLFGLTALSGAGVYFRTLWLAQAGNRIVARLKQRLLASILSQESAFLDQQTTGDLLSRLTSDAQLVQSAVTTQAVSGLRGLVMSTGSAGMLLYTSPPLAVISCCTLPPIFILTRHFGRRLAKQQEAVQQLLGDATSLAEQSLGSVTTVKQFVAEDFESNRYRNAIAAAHTQAVDTAHNQAQLEAGASICGNAAILGVLGYGGTLVMDGSISAGDLTGFVMYSLLLAGNLSGLTSVYSDLVRAMASSDRIFDILDRTPAIRSKRKSNSNDNNNIKLLSSGEETENDPLATVDYVHDLYTSSSNEDNDDSSSTTTTKAASALQAAPLIQMEGLHFRYPARPDIAVLKNLSLTIAPGEVVALVGGSGSGKSTVASLLTRLYDADEPSMIRLDGRPLCEYDLDDLRRRMVGIVSQDPVLFRGTIRDNIRYGEFETVSEDDILEAARQAHVLDFAQGFPDGLDTMVGPRGMQLSGGQRQRIALARVLAKNPPIIILDEATSALDAQSEHLVQEALQALFHQNSGRTILSIAHRLSTIRHASRIAVVRDGSIVQTGTFEELRAIDGPFRDLMKTQLVGDVSL